MNWEETIQEVRRNPSFSDLVKEAYLSPNLKANVLRFLNSAEFSETIKEFSLAINNSNRLKLLDIGAGNGISTVSFALRDYDVTALEPDPSDTVGAGAIRKVARLFKIEDKVKVDEAWGEQLPYKDNTFDIVYGRQVMHHADDLNKFVSEASRVLKVGGLFMTTRDHVIKDKKDKEAFLDRHPLHKFYGGENAFTLEEYEGAITDADLSIVRSLDASQSVINYDPWGKRKIKEKLGVISNLPFVYSIAMMVVKYKLNRIPGRLHTFLAIKN